MLNLCEHFVKAFYLRAFHNLIFFGFFPILAFYTIFTPFSSDHGIQFSHFLKDAFFSAKVIVDIHRHIDMSMSHNIVLLLSCHQKTALFFQFLFLSESQDLLLTFGFLQSQDTSYYGFGYRSCPGICQHKTDD